MKKVMIIVVLVGMVIGAGCQVEWESRCSAKYIRKGENNNQEWLSRNTGAFTTPIYNTESKTSSMLPMVGERK